MLIKKIVFLLSFLLCILVICDAQGTLQFNQVLIVTNIQMTVPAGKAWKVTSIHGAEFTLNQCVSGDPSFDWLGLKCNSDMALNSPRSARVSYFSSQLIINGV